MHNQDSRIQARFSPPNKEFLSMSLIFIFSCNFSNNKGHCKPQSTHFTACYSLYKTTASNSKLKYVLFLNSCRACLHRYSTKLSSNHRLCQWKTEQHPTITELVGNHSPIVTSFKVLLFQSSKYHCLYLLVWEEKLYWEKLQNKMCQNPTILVE